MHGNKPAERVIIDTLAQHVTMYHDVLLYLLMLSLLWSLEEVHSQSFPRLSFMGQTLANHSYVDISQVGRPDVDSGEGVQCMTDLSTASVGRAYNIPIGI